MNEPVRLTTFAARAGCASKIGPADLAAVLRDVPPPTDPNLLVGTNTADDAGVYRLSDDLALVQTMDFFTPVLDDPYDFGRVAAANALSDVYAMGGTPITAMNVLTYPPETLAPEVVRQILLGGAAKVAEAGATLVGGHSVQDAEPKYGLSVTGTIHPDRIFRNVGAQPGDLLVLSKPIGTGVLTTALKRGALGEEGRRMVTEGMATLNKTASEAMREVVPNAATDVTGFGLLGHLREMTVGSGVSAVVYFYNVPFYQGFMALAEQEMFPGGAYKTRAYVKPYLVLDAGVTETQVLCLCDPQTSGGLLMAVPRSRHQQLLDALTARGCSAATVGEIVASDGDTKITIAG